MQQVIAVKKLMQVKAPNLSSMKRATERGEKCCGGAFPHTHDNNDGDRKKYLATLMEQLEKMI